MISEKKVQEVNAVNKYAEQAYKELRNFWENYVGEKVIKKTPYVSLTKKVEDELNKKLEEMENDLYRIQREFRYDYDIAYKVYLKNAENSNIYKTIFIATISEGVLKELRDAPKFCTYSAEEVNEWLQAKYDHENLAREFQRKLGEFL